MHFARLVLTSEFESKSKSKSFNKELSNFTFRSYLCVERFLILAMYSDMEETEKALLFECQCI